MKKIYAPHELAQDIMDCFFHLYQYVACGLGLDTEDEAAVAEAEDEAIKYARRKFLEAVGDFENVFPELEIRWVQNNEKEEEA